MTGVPFPTSPLGFSEIGYLLLPSRDMAEIPLNLNPQYNQPTNLSGVSNTSTYLQWYHISFVESC